MFRYIGFIIRFRFAVLAIIILITVLAALSMTRGVIASSAGNLFLGDSPDYADYLERTGVFGNDELVIIGFEDPSPLSKPSLERLDRAVKNIRKLPYVNRVSSILDAYNLEVVDGVLESVSYSQKALSNPELADRLKKKLASDPLLGGLMVSKDGGNSIVLIELTQDTNRRIEAYPGMIEEIYDIFAECGFDKSKLHRIGMVAVFAEIMHQSIFNLTRLLPIVALVLLITVFVMFRRLWPVLITGLTASVGVIWTMGFAVLLYRQVNILMALTPGVILIISFSDVIHLCSSYLIELSKRESKKEAILKSGSEVGAACFYTSITTFAGFVSMALVPAPVFRQMGIVLGFGVAVSLLVAMTLSPILFSIMKRPKAWRAGTTSKVQGLLDRFLASIANLATGRPRTVVAVFAVLVVVSIIGVSRITIETDFHDRLSPGNRLRIDQTYFEDNFIGTNYLDIFIETSETDGIMDPDLFEKITRYRDALLDIPEVDKVVSVVDVVETVHRRMRAGENVEGKPISGQALEDYFLLFDLSDEIDLSSLVDSDYRIARLSVFLDSYGFAATYDAGRKAQEASIGIEDKAQVEVSGLLYLLGAWLDEVIEGQKRGLAFAFFTIFIMMAFALRSVRAGLWSMIPNAIPILVLGGYIGWFWDKVDSDTIMVAMVAIGIAVDDTIHFLMRYRIEHGRTGDVERSIQNAFHYSGRAIIITTVILAVGFAPFVISDYFTTRMLGTLLPASLVVALAADLVLAPAMVKLGAFKMPDRETDPDLTQKD